MVNPMDRIAGAVSDGKAIDWIKEKSARPEHMAALEQLAVVDRIRKVHESCARASDLGDETDTKPVSPLGQTPKAAPPLFHWGSLEVAEQVGEGGGGEVYRAFDPGLQAEVALKLLRRDYADSGQLARRFLDEARQLARVRHNNVLIVHGADQHGGRVGMWTEFVHGKSLEHYLAEHGRLSACEAAVIGMELCRALAAVHSAGLVHRDVKTTNVMREDGGRIVLMDFGSVLELNQRGLSTWSAGVQGTPITMPPEQLRGKVAGPATDIYALGVLLYRLVTRRFPIEAASLEELDEKHRRSAQTPLRDRRPDLAPEFVRVVEQALQADPAKRFQSAGAMEQALATTLGALAKQDRLRRRHQGALVTLGVAAAVAAGLFVGARLQPKQVASGQDRIAAGALAPKPEPLSGDVSLVRRVGGVELPLAPGSRVSPGDEIGMFLRGSDSMHVYILNEDETGKIYGLFPIPGLAPSNPLRGHEQHRLPGSLEKETFYWTVTSPGERERIIVIGARERNAALDSTIAKFPRARRGAPIEFGRIDPAALENWRGMGGGVPIAPPEGESRRRLQAALEGITARGRESGDMWIQVIELRNPVTAR